MDSDLIPVSIDSIRVSLVSAHRIVVLKDNEDRFLPIWIGPFEADAISIALQGNQAPAPRGQTPARRTQASAPSSQVSAQQQQILSEAARSSTEYVERQGGTA